MEPLLKMECSIVLALPSSGSCEVRDPSARIPLIAGDSVLSRIYLHYRTQPTNRRRRFFPQHSNFRVDEEDLFLDPKAQIDRLF